MGVMCRDLEGRRVCRHQHELACIDRIPNFSGCCFLLRAALGAFVQGQSSFLHVMFFLATTGNAEAAAGEVCLPLFIDFPPGTPRWAWTEAHLQPPLQQTGEFGFLSRPGPPLGPNLKKIVQG